MTSSGPEVAALVACVRCLHRQDAHGPSGVCATCTGTGVGGCQPEQAATGVPWPRYYDGSIMWNEIEPYERPVGCLLCGAAVIDTQAHVRWHDAQGASHV